MAEKKLTRTIKTSFVIADKGISMAKTVGKWGITIGAGFWAANVMSRDNDDSKDSEEDKEQS